MLLGMTAVVIGQGLFGLLALSVVPFPAAASLPYVAASVALHVGYQVFLVLAYRIGDLTQVYPIARGSAPLIVAGVSAGFLGVDLAPLEWAGVVVIATGIISLSLVRRSGGLRGCKAELFALTTGCFIAAYSLSDGVGARLAGTAVGFYGLTAAINAVLFTAVVGVRRGRGTRSLLAGGPRLLGVVLIGGGACFGAYAMVVWAFTEAPIALVTALRETSIVFALLIGVAFLKERLDLARLASTMITIGGVALLRLAR
jgi:drug/metabolite transporter (DMT)-like permease